MSNQPESSDSNEAKKYRIGLSSTRITDDNSAVSMQPDTMEKSQPFRGDTIMVKVPAFSSFPSSPNDCPQMFPTMYPALAPGLIPLQNQEQMNHGAGIYAVPVLPFMGHIAGFPLNTLIPLTYNIPTFDYWENSGAFSSDGQTQNHLALTLTMMDSGSLLMSLVFTLVYMDFGH
ncbi:hypothetical protein L1049_000243 [Liquidambar formosana]|uniref:Uncharacterized protein n=1 Tax=Liquidambar formosana TaxID=63359 RepID=A0AAP0NAP4_LIQFO